MAFQIGISGNPNGRKAGSRNKATLLLEALLDGEAEAVTRTVIQKAKAGDMIAARLVLDRIVPPVKERRVQLALPSVQSAKDIANALQQVIAAVAGGDIAPHEGQAIATLLDTQRKAIETEALEQRLTQLEERLSV
jgi:hypothetical protein